MNISMVLILAHLHTRTGITIGKKRVFLNLGMEYYFNDETSFTISGFTRNSDNLSNNSTIIQDLNQNKEILNEFEDIKMKKKTIYQVN